MKTKSLIAGLMMSLMPFGNAFAGFGTINFLQVNSGTLLISLSDGSACSSVNPVDITAVSGMLMTAQKHGALVGLICPGGLLTVFSGP